MAMELKMVNPHFEAVTFYDGKHWYSLVFDGWNGIESIDEDGDEFYYQIVCEDTVWNHADAYAYGYSWFFSKIYSEYNEDDFVSADFSNTEIEIVVKTMLEAIKNGGIE